MPQKITDISDLRYTNWNFINYYQPHQLTVSAKYENSPVTKLYRCPILLIMYSISDSNLVPVSATRLPALTGKM